MFIIFLKGLLKFKPENRRKRVAQERRPVFLPHLPVPSTPQSSTFKSTPSPQNAHFSNSGGQQDRVNSVGASPSNPYPPVEENIKVETKEPRSDDAALTKFTKMRGDSVGPACLPSPPSMLSNGALSDVSGPPSSVFSRSTNLSGWISGLAGDQCQESNRRCQDHRPSPGRCALTLPFCQHR